MHGRRLYISNTSARQKRVYLVYYTCIYIYEYIPFHAAHAVTVNLIVAWDILAGMCLTTELKIKDASPVCYEAQKQISEDMRCICYHGFTVHNLPPCLLIFLVCYMLWLVDQSEVHCLTGAIWMDYWWSVDRHRRIIRVYGSMT